MRKILLEISNEKDIEILLPLFARLGIEVVEIDGVPFEETEHFEKERARKVEAAAEYVLSKNHELYRRLAEYDKNLPS